MNINNIRQRLSIYFKHHVVVHLAITPVPITSKEVSHLHNNFKTLGNLEYFKINRDRSKLTSYNSKISLIYNPSIQPSQLSPFNHVPNDINETYQDIVDNQKQLIDKLNRLLGIPRYSFVENDQEYWDGKIEIPFKYKLNKDGLKYDKKYKITSSIQSNQFLCIDNNGVNIDEINEFRKKIRHNFQKFHKFDSVGIKIGLDSINEIIGYKKLKPYNQPLLLNYENLLNLNNDIQLNESNDSINLKLLTLTKGFKGFYN